jgi:hypothetical protein
MDIPELPPKFQDRFEVAKARAELEYAIHLTPFDGMNLTLSVILAFCEQARNACRERMWSTIITRQTAEAAVSAIHDYYFVRDCNAHSEVAKAQSRVAFLRVLKGESGWKQHLSELVALANAASPVTLAPSSEHGETRAAFADRILTERGWSQLDWANEAGVDKNTIRDYVNGTTRPRASSLKKMADALEIEVSEMPQ